MRLTLVSFTTLLCIGISTAYAATSEPTTDDQKTLYALGVAVSQSLGSFNLNESELVLFKGGLTVGVLKRPHKVELQTFGP